MFVFVYQEKLNGSEGDDQYEYAVNAADFGYTLTPERNVEIDFDPSVNYKILVFSSDVVNFPVKVDPYNITIEQVFEKLPLGEETALELAPGEIRYFQYDLAQMSLLQYQLTGTNLKDIVWTVYNDTFQAQDSKQLGNVTTFSRKYLHLYMGGADGTNPVNYIAIANNSQETKTVGLYVQPPTEISGDAQGERTVEEKDIVQIAPSYGGKYFLSMHSDQLFGMEIFDETLHNVYSANNLHSFNQNLEISADKRYYLVTTFAGAATYHYQWYFNPTRVFVNDNTVQVGTEDAYFLFVPKLDGTYRFSTQSTTFLVNGIDSSQVSLAANSRNYLTLKSTGAGRTDKLSIQIAHEDLGINQQKAVAASDGETYYAFAVTQTGNYRFSLGAGQQAEVFDLYTEQFNLLEPGMPTTVDAVLTAGQTYYIQLKVAQAAMLTATFEPSEIDVNAQIQMLGTHWYKFVPQSSESYLFYVMGDSITKPVSVRLYDRDLSLLARSEVNGTNSGKFTLAAETVYYLEIVPDTGAGVFLFGLEYENPAAHQETAIEMAEGVVYTPVMVAGTTRLYHFRMPYTGNYQLRLLKNYVNPMTVKLHLAGTVSTVSELPDQSSATKKIYALNNIGGNIDYLLEIKTSSYEVPSLMIVFDYQNVIVSAVDRNGKDLNEDYLADEDLKEADVYPGDRYTIGLKGSRYSARTTIGYDKEYEILSYNGQPICAKVDKNGILTVNSNAPLDRLVIVRVRCAFQEYVAVFRVVYPVKFSSHIEDNSEGLAYCLDVDCMAATIPANYGVYRITLQAKNASDGAVLKTYESFSWVSKIDFTTLNYYDDVVFAGEVEVRFNGDTFLIHLPDLQHVYRTNCSVNNPTVTGSNRMIMDLTSVSTSAKRTIAVQSTIKTLNLRSTTGMEVANLYFTVSSVMTINLYNVNLRGFTNSSVFYFSTGTITLNVLGTNTITGGSGTLPQSAIVADYAVIIQTGSNGILRLFGGNGANGSNGTKGTKGADGAEQPKAATDGENGRDGGNGSSGGAGRDGAAALTATKVTLQGTGSVAMTGGAGGQGGTGGEGGQGGQGGRAGGAGFLNTGGTGGTGGKGGTGGNGGAGGRGGLPYNTKNTSFSAESGVTVTLALGKCGRGGNGGAGGTGGQGGDGGGKTTNLGTDGRGGNGGTGGQGGNSGTRYYIYFTDYRGTRLSETTTLHGNYGRAGYGGAAGLGGNNNNDKKGSSGSAGSAGSYGTTSTVTY